MLCLGTRRLALRQRLVVCGCRCRLGHHPHLRIDGKPAHWTVGKVVTVTKQQAAWQHRPDLVDIEFANTLRQGPNISVKKRGARVDLWFLLAVILALLIIL